MIKGLLDNMEFILINAYRPTSSREKIEVWNQILKFLKNVDNKCTILRGDCNAIHNPIEKLGVAGGICK